jgi:hypothetical protein
MIARQALYHLTHTNTAPRIFNNYRNTYLLLYFIIIAYSS